jgi:putative transposase
MRGARCQPGELLPPYHPGPGTGRRSAGAGLGIAPEERQTVLDELHSERFQDVAPAEVCATLLDEGRCLCSPRTLYRILSAAHEGVKERRRHVQRPHYSKPE